MKAHRQPRKLLTDPAFLFRVGRKVHELGIVGERRNGVLLFLAGLTKEFESFGIPVIFTTTTSSELFKDDETRYLSLFSDDSPQQTQKILLSEVAQQRERPEEPPVEVWQEAIRVLCRMKPHFSLPRW